LLFTPHLPRSTRAMPTRKIVAHPTIVNPPLTLNTWPVM
jgi:hypothetical protein